MARGRGWGRRGSGWSCLLLFCCWGRDRLGRGWGWHGWAKPALRRLLLQATFLHWATLGCATFATNLLSIRHHLLNISCKTNPRDGSSRRICSSRASMREEREELLSRDSTIFTGSRLCVRLLAIRRAPLCRGGVRLHLNVGDHGEQCLCAACAARRRIG